MIATGAPDIWATIGVGLDLTGAIATAAVAISLWPRRQRLAGAGPAVLLALALTSLWSIALAAAAAGAIAGFVPSLFETARNLGWLYVVFRLFGGDGRDTSLAPIRPVIAALCFVEVFHLGIDYGLMSMPLPDAAKRVAFEFNVMFRLLVTVGGLVLVHNLYAGCSHEARPALRWPTIGLAVLWAFDLNLYTISYLASAWPSEIAALRGLATLTLALFIGLSVSANRDELRIRPSRAVTFQTFSLLVIGAYLVGMVAVAQWLAYAGGNFARLIELAFLTLASAIALVVLPSRRLRSWLKVTLAKHFFQHRYDYREEWLRFTRTIGSGGTNASPLGERVVKSVADLFESPGGLLLAPGEHGELTLAARWNWPEVEVPAIAMSLQVQAMFERTGYIVDLDETRRQVEGGTAAELEMPSWLMEDARSWAVIPLIHFERLVGTVVLARPQLARTFDWEDLDLLRVISQQVASYLAENASQLALAEASRFDDFHRRIAFVMHDIKNLASQFSLLARNAELHADKPAFRADMLVTLRNSSEKLNALIARLGRYGTGAVEKLENISTREILAAVAASFSGSRQFVLVESPDLCITANRHSIEQVLVHLVQNGIDASEAHSPVFLSVAPDGLHARFEVLDSGCGMSAEFVRNGLFKPFVSTKSGGFGIGAFEARELVRAMRGRLDVESREGLGSRFVVRIPLSEATNLYQNLTKNDQKVA
ncbi:PEP-CTERM system histidine kinase PrsK [Novosphingobium profundi]|uniref:XrtA/PEP-CTERM system histidine kinase PrsK n=1 Tax=Novosphingobium profundi TaxID=1774954 RepID=UPI001BDB0265|nr:XrtA/PEP-CTERM system histidine kinase PrsK [Novosphingobium profundi]MBT0669101.1 PEP-CTERM system histidine kinase PrsK [Novosphingobium profundi]